MSWMCENKEKSPVISGAIKKALGMKCGERTDNCMHLVIRNNFPSNMITDLIEKMTEETLGARDLRGFTPLHYAVEYERCTDSQLHVVKALIQHGNSALDMLSNKPDNYSVYGYHESTRQIYMKTKTPKGPFFSRKPTDNPRERTQAITGRETRQPDGSNGKQPFNPGGAS